MTSNELSAAHSTSAPAPSGPAALLQQLIEKFDGYEQKQAQLIHRVEKLENEAPIRHQQSHLLEKARKKRVITLLGGKESAAYQDAPLRAATFIAIMTEYKNKFGVAVYSETPRAQYDRATHFYAHWEPDYDLFQRIQDANNAPESEDTHDQA